VLAQTLDLNADSRIHTRIESGGLPKYALGDFLLLRWTIRVLQRSFGQELKQRPQYRGAPKQMAIVYSFHLAKYFRPRRAILHEIPAPARVPAYIGPPRLAQFRFRLRPDRDIHVPSGGWRRLENWSGLYSRNCLHLSGSRPARRPESVSGAKMAAKCYTFQNGDGEFKPI
jgi:hypothetical protein